MKSYKNFLSTTTCFTSLVRLDCCNSRQVCGGLHQSGRELPPGWNNYALFTKSRYFNCYSTDTFQRSRGNLPPDGSIAIQI